MPHRESLWPYEPMWTAQSHYRKIPWRNRGLACASKLNMADSLRMWDRAKYIITIGFYFFLSTQLRVLHVLLLPVSCFAAMCWLLGCLSFQQQQQQRLAHDVQKWQKVHLLLAPAARLPDGNNNWWCQDMPRMARMEVDVDAEFMMVEWFLNGKT